MLRESARRCESAGVELLYHNHDWEFADEQRVMQALIEQTAIGFCPDIGWVMRGVGSVAGVKPVLERLGERVGALHMKDFATVQPDEGLNTVMLGEGVAPLREAAEWAKGLPEDMWLIAEQDQADGTPEEAITTNAHFLQSLIWKAKRR